MKAPDKIYIQTNAGEAFSSKWTTIPFRDFENTEYIRKDALLGWLESKVYEHNEDRFDDGFNAALGQVIDKINEL
jgi:hypothetical protein